MKKITKRLFNNFLAKSSTLLKGMSSKGLPLVMLIVCSILGTTDVWASTTTYYSRLTVQASPSGAGSVYASKNTTKGSSISADQAGSSQSQDYYVWADAKNGWAFKNWTGTGVTFDNVNNASGAKASVTANSEKQSNPSSFTATANFVASTATLTNGVFTTLEKSANVTASATFSTTNADNTNDFETPTISKQTGAGTFSGATCASWAGNVLTVNYTFNAGGAAGDHTATLTVASANGSTGGTSTNPTVTVHVAGLGDDVEGTGVATENISQVEHGTVTLSTTYITSQDQIQTPAISNVSGTGAITMDSWSWAGNVLTVNYIFDPQGFEGTTTADLNVAINATTGDSKTIPLMGTATPPVAYEAEVEVAGEIVKTGTFAECLTHANTLNTNPTLRLRNDVSGITAKQSITKSMTLDLNSNTISGAMTKAEGLLDINGTGITVTITDNSSRKEGKISNISASGVYLYGVYVTKGTLNLEEGFVYCENTNGTASSNYRANGIGTAAGTTLNVNGGRIEAVVAKDYSYGISSYGTTTISGGEIVSTGANAIRGVIVYAGTTTLNGGSIYAETTSTTDATGVYLSTGANCVFTMNDGQIETLSKTTTSRGVFLDVANGVVNINGGSILATSTTTTAYGIHDDKGGVINVSGGTINAVANTATARGIYMNHANTAVNVTDGTILATCSTTPAYGIHDDKGGAISVSGGLIHGTANGTNLASAGYAQGYGVSIANSSKNASFTGGTLIGECARASYGRYGYGLYTARSLTIDGNCTFKGISAYQYGWGIQVAGGTTTFKNGTIFAECVNDARGVQVSGNVAGTIGFIFEGGTITAQTTTGSTARGIYGTGNIDVKGGTIIAKAGTTAKNTTSQGICVDASANADPTKSYYGTLNMTGGNILSVASSTTAYGVYVNAARVYMGTPKNEIEQEVFAEAHISGGTILAKVEGAEATTTAIGVRSYGNTFIEDGATITAQTVTTTAYGVDVRNGKTVVNGGTITATAGTTTAYGAIVTGEINGSYGYQYNGDLEINDGTFNVATTTGEKCYGIYVSATSTQVTKSGYEAYHGYYAAKGHGLVNGGIFNVNAKTTTAYGVYVGATSTTGTASATPTCEITGGKYKVSGTGTLGAVNAAALAENFQITGGYYNINAGLATYLPSGYTAWSLTNGTEYDQGYRYAVALERPKGVEPCKVTNSSGTTLATFYSLELALTYVNQNAGSEMNIIMLSDYVLPAGYYTIPANVTLVVPRKDGVNKPQGTTIERENASTAVSLYRTLTFESGVHMEVSGNIEIGGKQNNYGSGSGGSGRPIDTYAQLVMNEGSTITIMSGAQLRAYGFITGKGEIDARRGSTVYEQFQIYDFRGGSCTLKMNNNTKGFFPVNQYYIQNIEVPVKFHPGSKEYTQTAVVQVGASVQIIGTEGETALFTMAEEADEEDTWVRKEYDPVRDRQIYAINSAAKLNAVNLKLSSYSFNSSSYVLPITNNMDIHLLSGEMEITQNVKFLAGATLEIDKEATGKIKSGKSVYFYSASDWGTSAYNACTFAPVGFSPSWKTNPRKGTALTNAEMNIHGTLEVNGAIYTSTDGANIISQNENAGTIIFNVAAPTTNAIVNECNNASPSYAEHTFVPALLNNGNASTVSINPTAAGQSYCYIENEWKKLTTSGCFVYDNYGVYYAKPHDYVALSSNTEDGDHLYHSQDGTRDFILMDDCQWWEVEQTEEDDAVYYCADNGIYYYYDNEHAEWAEKKITVTWANYDGTTYATYTNVPFGGTPKFLGTNPKRPNDTYYTYSFVGWLPEITEDSKLYENTTYVAQYERKDLLYAITFKDGGTTIETDYYSWGSMPECEKAPTKSGYILSWSPALGAVSDNQTYTAVWTAETVDPTTLTYTVTWKNYNGTTLETDNDVAYGVLPSYDGATPAKAAIKDIAFEHDGWTPDVEPVTANVVYTAKFREVAAKYTVTFKAQDGSTVIESQQVAYGEVPVCQNMPTQPSTAEYYYVAKWDKEITAVTGNVTYTHTGFDAYKNTCRLTVAAGAHGSVLLDGASDPLSAIYDYGTNAVISATADAHYHFVQWSDGNTENPRTIHVTETKSVTAQFAIDQVTITWLNYDGSTITTSEVDYGSTPAYSGATPNRPAGCGVFYTFNGWSPAFAAVTTATSYTAQYNEVSNPSLKSYQVAFVANGGTGTMTNQAFTYGTAQNLKANTFAHASYTITYVYANGDANSNANADVTFNGWSDGANSYTDQQSVNNLTDVCDGVVTMTAQWQTQSVIMPTPEKIGYAFNGWFDAATDGNKIGDAGTSYRPSADITLYAQWSANQYTITFDSNGGSAVASIKQDYNTTITAPANPTREGYTFVGWLPEIPSTMPAEDITLTAQWTPVESGDYLDIVDWTSNSLTINMNGSSQKITIGTTTKDKNAREANRTMVFFGLSLAPGDDVLIAARNNTTNALESFHTYKVPYIYTGTDINPGTTDEVWVKSGTWTVSGDRTIAKLVVCPGADVKITSGTLTVSGKLVLRTTPWESAAISGEFAADQTYYTRIIDKNDAYYHFGLPLACNIDDVRLSNGKTVKYRTSWVLHSYNGANRAANGADGNNWDVLADPSAIAANVGYEMFSNSNYYCEYYFPVNPADLTATTLTAKAYTSEIGSAHQGWNVLVAPKMGNWSIYTGGDSPEDFAKICRLVDLNVYEQCIAEDIRPAIPFYYQNLTAANETLHFEPVAKAIAARRSEAGEAVQTQWLRLYYFNEQGTKDETNIYLNSDKFTSAYEVGYDVTKMSTSGSRPLIYTQLPCGDLAFTALPDEALIKQIPLTVYSPTSGDYTFSMKQNRYLTRMKNVWILDVEEGALVDLMQNDYTTQVGEGTTAERFYLLGKFRSAQTPTDLEELGSEDYLNNQGNADVPRKVIYDEHMYILYHNHIWDANGKLIK